MGHLGRCATREFHVEERFGQAQIRWVGVSVMAIIVERSLAEA
jgi:hypothetical protein